MYDLIAANKRNSWMLIFAIGILLLGTAVAIGTAVTNDVVLSFAIATIVTIVYLVTTYYSGSGMILAMSGARKIEHADHPQLFNVVEEMSIAAGLPMPEVYIIDDSAPNAFATGRDPEHAVVAITEGLLEKLDRDELQGVMAHELSHVRNYDIRFAMLVAVMVGAIALLCDFFWRISFRRSHYGGSRNRNGGGAGGAQVVAMIIALVLAILAPIVAKIIQFAISRQREYLADASAAELTRYPEGLARALEKIAGDREPLEAANRATQHLYIVNPLKGARVAGLFSTHPPMEERVARLRSIAGLKTS